ncbi:hypothetical protein C8Q77DRAFT_1078835 [Trametes polyzona]|nr:hypothetical protein C8Q77DRAFT_1078835 [Trametes polyzona]
MFAGLRASNTWNSSAWPLVHASADLLTGLAFTDQLRPMHSPAGMGYFGRLDVSGTVCIKMGLRRSCSSPATRQPKF